MIQADHDNSPKWKSKASRGEAPESIDAEETVSQPVERLAVPQYDVAIVGAGMGGLAACIFLRRAGLRVVCLEAEPFPHARVGESLDWSTPRLLRSLGLPRDQLIDEKVATYKRCIQVTPLGESAWSGQPPDWFSNKPLGFEVMTLHVDRVEFDQRLYDMAQELGVTFIWDRVSAVDTDGRRVLGCRTATDEFVTASWFIDGSGRARLFANAFGITKVEYGRHKVCLWRYFDTPPFSQGTTFFGNSADEYLTWIWDIPITPDRTSVGCVMPAEHAKEQRKNGTHLTKILRDELAKYARFSHLLAEQPDGKVYACSYRSYVSRRVCGPNWMMVGESASFPDPLTANGVTAAFRHAREATNYIQQSLEKGSLSKRQQYIYDANVRQMGHAFNHSIETALYDWPVRRGLHGLVAQRAYTAFSYFINALYSKVQPQSLRATVLFGLLLRGVWAWVEAWSLLGKLTFRTRQLWR